MEQKKFKKKKDLEAFLELQRRFPLRPLKSHAELRKALRVLSEIGAKDNKMSAVESDYFDVLSMLIGKYEKPIAAAIPKTTPRENLRYLIELNGWKQKDLIPAVSESHLSDYLHGRRNLSTREIAKLSGFLKLDPSFFMEPIEPIKPSKSTMLLDSIKYPVAMR